MPAGVITSIAFGTPAGSNVQCGSALAVMHTPNWKPCGVGVKPRAWSGLKPSWPVRTTVKPQPDPGVPPSAVFGTLNVMYRVMAFAPIVIVPTVAPPASTRRWPKPCTSSRRLQAPSAAIA